METALYIISLAAIALITYFVCFLEHNRVLQKVKEQHRLERLAFRRRIQALTSDNSIHAWQAWMECFEDGVLEMKE